MDFHHGCTVCCMVHQKVDAENTPVHRLLEALRTAIDTCEMTLRMQSATAASSSQVHKLGLTTLVKSLLAAALLQHAQVCCLQTWTFLHVHFSHAKSLVIWLCKELCEAFTCQFDGHKQSVQSMCSLVCQRLACYMMQGVCHVICLVCAWELQSCS